MRSNTDDFVNEIFAGHEVHLLIALSLSPLAAFDTPSYFLHEGVEKREPHAPFK